MPQGTMFTTSLRSAGKQMSQRGKEMRWKKEGKSLIKEKASVLNYPPTSRMSRVVMSEVVEPS